MWTREQIKGNAKYVLGFSYWKALLACLIISFVAGVSNMSGSSTSYMITYQLSGSRFSWRIGGVLLAVFFMLTVIGLLFGIFVVNPIAVGKCRFFIANRQNRGGYDQIFSLFRSGVYLNVVKTMFLRDLYTVLWSLLLIVPGIVKSYEYSMIPYILAENPQIDSSRAFAVSRSMTNGEKAAIFILDWSFLGWMILGVMACGVGTLFVAPYIQATYAELYEVLKYKAITIGATGVDELGGPNGYTGEREPGYYPYYAAPGGTAGTANQSPFSSSRTGYQTNFSGEHQNSAAPVQNPAREEPAQSESWFEQQIEKEKKGGLES